MGCLILINNNNNKGETVLSLRPIFIQDVINIVLFPPFQILWKFTQNIFVTELPMCPQITQLLRLVLSYEYMMLSIE